MNAGRSRGSRAATFVALFFLGACSDEILTPSPAADAAPERLEAGLAQAQGKGRGRGNPNSQKYSDTGVKPATGRSGSATLEVRALLGSDGQTVLEASTGSLAGGTSVGDIDKAQVKLLAGGTTTLNYNKLSGGYWTESYGGLVPGDAIQVQANVSGIDGKRTNVITVQTEVALRPNLAVGPVTGPATAPPSFEVAFSAPVSETNGDVGARADCVLTVDGLQVDEAEGIWVDAGGTVSCLFRYSFDAPGTYEVGIAAENVDPEDWDTSDNAAATSITIQSPDSPVANGSLEAQRVFRNRFLQATNFGSGFVYATDSSSVADFSSVLFAGTDAPHAGPWSRVEATISLDGTVVRSLTTLFTESETTATAACQWGFSAGVYGEVCTHDDAGGDYNSYAYSHMAGAVTYFGNELFCANELDPFSCVPSSWNENEVYDGGIAWTFDEGSEVRFEASFVDASEGRKWVDRTVDMGPVVMNLVVDSDCGPDAVHGGTICWETSVTEFVSTGSTSW